MYVTVVICGVTSFHILPCFPKSGAWWKGGSTLKGCKATSKSFGNDKCGKLLSVKILILVSHFFVNGIRWISCAVFHSQDLKISVWVSWFSIARGWKVLVFKVYSNPNCSMIL